MAERHPLPHQLHDAEGCHLRYSIEKYMKVLQLQRPAIASQLESAYGAPPVKLEDDQKRRIREFAQAYLHKMEQADSIAQQLRNNPGDKEYRNSITAILLAHERQYGPKPSKGSGSRQSGIAENGQHVNGNMRSDGDVLRPTGGFVHIIPEELVTPADLKRSRELLVQCLDKYPHYLIGHEAHKHFPEWNCVCRGRVISVDEDHDHNTLCRSRYDADGEEEDFDIPQMLRHVIMP